MWRAKNSHAAILKGGQSWETYTTRQKACHSLWWLRQWRCRVSTGKTTELGKEKRVQKQILHICHLFFYKDNILVQFRRMTILISGKKSGFYLYILHRNKLHGYHRQKCKLSNLLDRLRGKIFNIIYKPKSINKIMRFGLSKYKFSMFPYILLK